MEDRTRIYDLLWYKHCLPKAEEFVWLAIKGRILTCERRKRLGFVGPKKCVMCGEEEENLDHLLLQCKVAQSCWLSVKRMFYWHGPLQQSLIEFFESWPRQNRKSTLSSMWNISPSLVIWEIWKERNQRIFQDKKEDERMLVSRINQAIEEALGEAASQMESPIHS